MSDLLELAKRCEAATGPDRELDADIWMAVTPGHSRVLRTVKSDKGLWPDYVIDETRDASGRLIIVPFYSESLDAAVTLVPEGLAWTTGQNVHHWYWQTGVNRLNEDGAPESVSCSGPARTPALALCAAALRAKAAPAPKPPYPFCRTPEKCAGKGYCPAEFACND